MFNNHEKGKIPIVTKLKRFCFFCRPTLLARPTVFVVGTNECVRTELQRGPALPYCRARKPERKLLQQRLPVPKEVLQDEALLAPKRSTVRGRQDGELRDLHGRPRGEAGVCTTDLLCTYAYAATRRTNRNLLTSCV